MNASYQYKAFNKTIEYLITPLNLCNNLASELAKRYQREPTSNPDISQLEIYEGSIKESIMKNWPFCQRNTRQPN